MGNKEKIPAPNSTLVKVTGNAFVKVTGKTTVSENGSDGISVDKGSTVTVSDVLVYNNNGSGISNSGILTIENDDTKIYENTQRGVSNTTTGTLTFNGGSISKNLNGGISNAGTLYMTGGTVTENTVMASTSTAATGAGINNSGTLEISGGTISKNKVQNTYSGSLAYGGGIYLASGSATISGGAIKDNVASRGSGIYNNITALSFKDDVLIDSSNDVYLYNTLYQRSISVSNLTQTGTLANITMYSYTSYNTVLKGTDLTQDICNKFVLGNQAYCVEVSGNTSGVSKMKGSSGSVYFPEHITFTAKKKSSGSSSTTTLSSGDTITTSDVLSFIASPNFSSSVTYKIAVMQGDEEIPSLTKTSKTSSGATVTIPAQLAMTKPTVSIYMSVTFTYGGKQYVFDNTVTNIKVP